MAASEHSRRSVSSGHTPKRRRTPSAHSSASEEPCGRAAGQPPLGTHGARAVRPPVGVRGYRGYLYMFTPPSERGRGAERALLIVQDSRTYRVVSGREAGAEQSVLVGHNSRRYPVRPKRLKRSAPGHAFDTQNAGNALSAVRVSDWVSEIKQTVDATRQQKRKFKTGGKPGKTRRARLFDRTNSQAGARP